MTGRAAGAGDDTASALLLGADRGHAAILPHADGTTVSLMLPNENTVYRWWLAGNASVLEELRLRDVLPACAATSLRRGLDSTPSASACDSPQFPGSANLPIPPDDLIEHWDNPLGAIPAFDSRGGAQAVIYVDFDGESNMWQPNWYYLPFTVGHSGMTTEEMRLALETLAEDFSPFDISVTTSRSRYDQAPPGRRMHCIVTPTSHWAYTTFSLPQADGIAFRCSFSQAGQPQGYASDMKCFMFRDYIGRSGRHWGTVMAHEVGHTLGLSHDGPFNGTNQFDYYGGHGVGFNPDGTDLLPWTMFNMWSPIMGHGKLACISQWSNWSHESYPNLQNFEDDVAIIGGPLNGFGVAQDDWPDDGEAVAPLTVSGSSLAANGVIGPDGDTDAFSFTIPVQARVRLTIAPPQPLAEPDPWVRQYKNLGIANLNVRAKIYDAQRNLIRNESEPDNFRFRNDTFPIEQRLAPSRSLGAYFDRSLSPGTYHCVVSGDGFVDAAGDVYPAYGSMGRYVIEGIIDPLPVLSGPATATGTVGVPFQYQVAATGNPTSFSATGLPGGLFINDSGLISGSPAGAGTYAVTISGTGLGGTGQMSVSITISGSNVIGQAIDAPSLPWTTPSGMLGWFAQTAVTHDGVDAAQSSAIPHGSSAGLETTLTGPGTIAFFWKVSSERRWDALRFEVDGEVKAGPISEDTDWTSVAVEIPPGTHVARWVYQKDGSISAGADAGWVDEVVWTPSLQLPVITNAPTVTWSVGQLISYAIVATNLPTGYNLAGTLPPGLAYSPADHLVVGIPQRAGSWNVTLSATNSAGTSQQALSITVESSYDKWARDNGLTGSAALPGADPDGDGRPNLLELALNSNPKAKDAAAPLVTVDPTTRRLTATFTRVPSLRDVGYEVQVTGDFVNWTTIASSVNGAPMTSAGAFSVNDAGGSAPTTVTVVDDATPGSSSRRAMRIKISQLQ